MASLQARAFERRRCYLNARFVYDNGRCSLDSILRNISPAGARLSGADMRDVPETFDLVISSPGGASDKRRARRVWSSGQAMGIAFIG